jgi:murein DD-endopeptidase MepM/ murein hydrolase activator NlpD
MVKSRVTDVRSAGWWGKGATASPGHPISQGDGIVILEILESVGPFVKGYNIGYGHNEKAVVKVGDIVEAGDHIAHAGFARAWHIHLMYNDGSFGDHVGRGNLDPQKIVDYSVAHG